MTPDSTPRGRLPLQGLPLALLLGVALALLSYVRRVGDMNSAMFHNGILSALLAGRFWGTALARNMMLFALALLVLHLLFGLGCWVLACVSERAWPQARASRAHWVWLWALGFTIALLAHNAAAFQGSSLGAPYAASASQRWLGLRFADLLAGPILLAAAATLLRAGWQLAAGLSRRGILGLAAAGVGVAIIIAACSADPAVAPAGTAAQARPNVIVIGIDSLRNDLLPLDGTSARAPAIARFLRQSIRFGNAITPLARTYPSWLSILTGQHPHTTGGALNLLPRDLVRDRNALGFVLQRAGYRTVYGIDETRFSNIDASYGFDQAITPPIGASDFMIGWFGDTPLSNAVVNTRLGQWLFPHLHANRAAAITYDPDAYVRRVARELRTDGRPLFLALHLTLAHWPYVWKDSTEAERAADVSRYPQYLRAVRRVDAQFAALLGVLRARGLLDNAILIVLSDHGESFVPGTDSIGPGDSSVLQALEAVPGWGHGTSVLAPDQFRVVLGVQLPAARGGAAAGRMISAPVSVEDIHPTVCALLGITPETRVDGRSLLPLLRGDIAASPDFARRIRYTESEFTPEGIVDATNNLSTSGVTLASRYYRIDPVTDRLNVRRELLDAMLASRQFAAFNDRVLIAAIPDPQGGDHQYILVREPFRQGGRVERLAGEAQDAADPEVRRLWQALQAKFARRLRPRDAHS
ncbi:MAG: sulfatase-like hydrolase/transferase [Gammaproteobacteria bacterium]|nr:sulfatase-like hydrolase/transferase [Gammaproteobacteria bacterium]